MADELGVTPEQVRVLSGDSTALASGGGTHSDRSMRFAGTLMAEAGTALRAQATRVAAALLGVAEAEVTFEDGLFSAQICSPGGAERNPGRASAGANRRLSLFDLARALETDASLPAELRAPLSAETTVTNRIPAYPTGTAVCELEVDPETGAIEICRYTSLDDAGQPINPLILHGQVHGGIAQGLGQALMEAAAWQNGQPVAGSFMDYALPRAHALPNFTVALTEDPTSGNPLRIKGGGEAGITPALAACMNALMDAVGESGVEHIDMPATGERVWGPCITRGRGPVECPQPRPRRRPGPETGR
jgi:carbon-monoxide dehydrogenase large subunit